MSRRGTGKLLLGGAIGAGIALLFAPKKGEELRKDLAEKASELLEKIKDIDSEEVKENITNKVNEIKDDLKDLDSEKVKEIAAKKGEQIKAKTNDLVEYAKEKGTPIVKKTAKSVKKKAANVTKEVLAKLEDE